MLTLLPDDVCVTTCTAPTACGPCGVAVLVPSRPTRRVFIVAMGYGAHIDEFELQRFRLLANELRARLVVVETPGHGTPGSHLTWSERLRLLGWSDFLPVAERMVDAATAAEPRLATASVGVIGYSLGTSIGTAMAHVLHRRNNVPVPALVLVEPVSGRAWRPQALLAATRAEGLLVDEALAQNQIVDGAVLPTDRGTPRNTVRRCRLDLLLLANALRSGKLSEQVARSCADHVVVIRGDKSRLSLTRPVAEVTARSRAMGLDVRELEMVGSHALWHSLPSVRRIGSFVAGVLDGDR